MLPRGVCFGVAGITGHEYVQVELQGVRGDSTWRKETRFGYYKNHLYFLSFLFFLK